MFKNISGKDFTDGAKEAKFKPPWILQMLLFIVVFLTGSMIQSVVVIIAEILRNMISGVTDPVIIINNLAVSINNMSDGLIVINNLSTILPAAIAIIYCRFIERRSLNSMGLIKKGCIKKYLIGIAAGFAMYSVTLLISCAVGAASYNGTGMDSIPLFAVLCFSWFIQGAEEEIILRGYLMSSLSVKMPKWAAVLISSSAFSLLHIANGGFNFMAFLNITLIGILFGLLAIRFNSLLVSCAAHSIWNLVQGNFYGCPVSGINAGPSVFRFRLADNMNLWTGGRFGLEAGLASTIVIVLVMGLLIFIPKQNKEKA